MSYLSKEMLKETLDALRTSDINIAEKVISQGRYIREFDYKIDVNKLKALEFLINKTKSKIIKTDLFILVEKLNKRYNTKITAEEIICMLKKADNIQFALKNDILYIKK